MFNKCFGIIIILLLLIAFILTFTKSNYLSNHRQQAEDETGDPIDSAAETASSTSPDSHTIAEKSLVQEFQINDDNNPLEISLLYSNGIENIVSSSSSIIANDTTMATAITPRIDNVQDRGLVAVNSAQQGNTFQHLSAAYSSYSATSSLLAEQHRLSQAVADNHVNRVDGFANANIKSDGNVDVAGSSADAAAIVEINKFRVENTTASSSSTSSDWSLSKHVKSSDSSSSSPSSSTIATSTSTSPASLFQSISSSPSTPLFQSSISSLSSSLSSSASSLDSRHTFSTNFERVELEESQKKSQKLLLHRNKRYLLFPDGSSFQMVFDLIIPIVDYTNFAIMGITCAVAWELPSKPPSEIIDNFRDKLNNGVFGLIRRNDTVQEDGGQPLKFVSSQDAQKELKVEQALKEKQQLYKNPATVATASSLHNSFASKQSAISPQNLYYQKQHSNPYTKQPETLLQQAFNGAQLKEIEQEKRKNFLQEEDKRTSFYNSFKANNGQQQPYTPQGYYGQQHQQQHHSIVQPSHIENDFTHTPPWNGDNTAAEHSKWYSNKDWLYKQKTKASASYTPAAAAWKNKPYAGYKATMNNNEDVSSSVAGSKLTSDWGKDNWWDRNKERIQQQWQAKQQKWSQFENRADEKQQRLPVTATPPPLPTSYSQRKYTSWNNHEAPVMFPQSDRMSRNRKVLQKPPKHRIFPVFGKRRRRSQRRTIRQTHFSEEYQRQQHQQQQQQQQQQQHQQSHLHQHNNFYANHWKVNNDAVDEYENVDEIMEDDFTSLLDDIHMREHLKSRQKLYGKIEKVFKTRGHNGTACILRALCETQQMHSTNFHRIKPNANLKQHKTRQLHQQRQHEPQSFIMELLRSIFVLPTDIILSSNHNGGRSNRNGRSSSFDPSATTSSASHISPHYRDAVRQAYYHPTQNCGKIYDNCKHSIWWNAEF